MTHGESPHGQKEKLQSKRAPTRFKAPRSHPHQRRDPSRSSTCQWRRVRHYGLHRFNSDTIGYMDAKFLGHPRISWEMPNNMCRRFLCTILTEAAAQNTDAQG